MKKKKNVMYRKSVSLLAAAAMTAVLMTGQGYPVVAWGQNTETRLEKSSLIPENITIDQPVALSEVALPKSCLLYTSFKSPSMSLYFMLYI